ncbi:MAG: hypothetical protein ACRD4Q_01175 [Candidatus Acidiferrales bacterium]
MGASPTAIADLGYPGSSDVSSFDPFSSITPFLQAAVDSGSIDPSSIDYSAFDGSSGSGTMPFPSTDYSSGVAGSSAGIFSDIGSALSGVGSAIGSAASGVSNLVLAQKGLTPQAVQTAATAGSIQNLFSSFMPMLLIGALLIGGIVLLRHTAK